MTTREWLLTDGLGGFAMGTASAGRTRRYHGLCTLAEAGRRWLMVAAIDLTYRDAHGSQALSTHVYQGGVRHPDGATRLTGFSPRPWPSWRYRLDDGSSLELELLAERGGARFVLAALGPPRPGAMLLCRPLLAGRDMHALTTENDTVALGGVVRAPGEVSFQLYPGIPALTIAGSGGFVPQPDWYRRFQLDEEEARGFPHREDLASPGAWQLGLEQGAAALVMGRRGSLPSGPIGLAGALRASAPRPAAADYLVTIDGRPSVIAGYPWFGDWGRDTFIALRGLCLPERPQAAADILHAWAPLVQGGMLPNRFPEGGIAPEYHSVDAALW
jgi:glycogen debranching enzyme